MKCFLVGAVGAVGALLAVVLCVFVFAQYSDYRGRAQTEGIILQVEWIKKEVGAVALKRNEFAGVDGSVVKFGFRDPIDFADIFDGNILIRGSGGQVLIFRPSFSGGGVAWRCMGAPGKDMPGECKG
ncbi:hypothetical protein [Ralstonia solanacearum]|uniref:hypothetical protein n=1 Tax=Ralstonia solanacearum TaxID=305 RepID=UPI000B02AEDC|nr:hypothetical protein [Ralstonia solanacearum]